MGYDTTLSGRFTLDRPLTPEHKAVLKKLAQEEHVPGEDGKPVRDARRGHPCRFCQWVPTRDGTGIEWDHFTEKFYGWLEWLEYIIERHLRPWGYVLSGEVRWQGEDMGDAGVIYVKNNRVEAVDDANPGPSWDRKYVRVRPPASAPA